MRTLALALLLALSGSVAAFAQQHDPSYYSERAYQWRQDHPGQYYDERNPPWDNRQGYEDQRDAQRWHDEQAYERGRRDAERDRQNSGDNGNDIVNSIGRMFNNR